ncbi:MAG TPA: alpha/beta hydrolase [Clostridiaceae bacterium]
MLSKEAQQVIQMLRKGKEASEITRKDSINGKVDPLLIEIQGIYAERKMVDENARKVPLKDKLTLIPNNADGVSGEWLQYLNTDPEKQKDKVILFLHGGGFNTGSALARRFMTGNIVCNAKVDAFSIDYRRCPEYKFPAHLEDCVTTFLWLLKKGYSPKNIIIIGESAGANLALCISLYLKDHYFPTPGGVCVFSPFVDFDGRYDSRITRTNRDPMLGSFFPESEIDNILQIYRSTEPIPCLYCSVEEMKSPYVSPILGDFTDFPKLSIHVGSEELLYDDAIVLEKKAIAAGVQVTLHEWEGMFHCFPIFDTPEGDEACMEIGKFVRSI